MHIYIDSVLHVYVYTYTVTNTVYTVYTRPSSGAYVGITVYV